MKDENTSVALELNEAQESKLQELETAQNIDIKIDTITASRQEQEKFILNPKIESFRDRLTQEDLLPKFDNFQNNMNLMLPVDEYDDPSINWIKT